MKEFKELIRILFAIFRYPAAVVASYMASIVTAIYLPGFFPAWSSNDGHLGELVWYFSIGLAGVAAGSFCLPRNQRWIGSLFLLLLGLSFAFFVDYMLSEDNDSVMSVILQLVALAGGGIIPAAIHYLLKKKRPIKTPL